MTATIPFVNPVSQIRLAPGSIVTIPKISWQEFELILQHLGENRSARLIFYQNTLEIMVPLPEHEKSKELISDIIKILLKKTNRKYEPFGSTTFKKEGLAGVEPNVCFYSNSHSGEVRLTSASCLLPPAFCLKRIDFVPHESENRYIFKITKL